jgi:DNA-binding transcriptional LysR family regulator
VRRRIPSIETLIAFEAAARHLSFTRAADDLSLTQSAVCRQIAQLEGFLGVPLFNRIKRRLTLTDAGQVYAKAVRDDLNGLEKHMFAAMSHRGTGGVLELAVIPTFATRWLIPRLPEFYAKHSEITLNLTTRAEPFLFAGTVFDAAIHYGGAVWAGAIAEPLFGEESVPICAPALLRKSAQLPPRALAELTLLHQSARPSAWRDWFVQAGVHDINVMRGPRFEVFSMLVEAACVGLGVALVPRFLLKKELSDGTLVVPNKCVLRSEKGYYLVYPESKQGSSPLRAFRGWLLEAANEYRKDGQTSSVM